MSFKDLKLNKPLLRAIAESGYDNPTLVQEKTIPLVLDKKDVITSAQTGTGKTAAFALPLFEKIDQQEGLFNRILFYRRNSLHSGSISEHFIPDNNPCTGRLSINSFID